MDYKASADLSETYAAYYNYYRSLLDLQWTEYHIWKRFAIPDPPYIAWLTARCHDYKFGGVPTASPAEREVARR